MHFLFTSSNFSYFAQGPFEVSGTNNIIGFSKSVHYFYMKDYVVKIISLFYRRKHISTLQ